jgi:hypothetical protein
VLSDVRVNVIEGVDGGAAVSAAWSVVRVAGLTPRTNHFGLHQSPRSGFEKPSRHYHSLKPALQALTEASSDGKAVGMKTGKLALSAKLPRNLAQVSGSRRERRAGADAALTGKHDLGY